MNTNNGNAENTKFMDVFKGESGYVSIRKIGGFLALALVAYLIVSFTIATDFKVEIPAAYWGAIYIIIVFYFFKDTIRKARINSDDTSDNTEPTK